MWVRNGAKAERTMELRNGYPGDFNLTIDEAACILDVSRVVMDGLIREGAVPFVPVGRAKKVRRLALDAFLARVEAQGLDILELSGTRKDEKSA